MGVWFHEGKERESIANLLRQVIRTYTETKLDDSTTVDSTKHEKINYNQAVTNLLSSLRIGNSSVGVENVLSSQSNVIPTDQNNTESQECVILDKKSLQLTLLSLLQDDRFIDIIHGQYLRVVKARADKYQQTDRNKK